MGYFSDQTFRFFRELEANNNRDWFKANKQRYLECVRDPFLALIRDFNPRLQSISRYYSGSDKPVGGSLFRIYRDTRFSKDKTPYKCWAGARFTHLEAKARPAPVYYLHIQPGEVFVGAGIWHPESRVLSQVRTFLANNPQTWLEVTRDKAFKRQFRLGGDSLKRTPRGFDPDHPLAEDIKRKDFVVASELTEQQAMSGGFPALLERRFRLAGGFMDYLCAALDLEF